MRIKHTAISTLNYDGPIIMTKQQHDLVHLGIAITALEEALEPFGDEALALLADFERKFNKL